MFIDDANLHGFADDHTISSSKKTLEELKECRESNIAIAWLDNKKMIELSKSKDSKCHKFHTKDQEIESKRDSLYKTYTKEPNPETKSFLYVSYKIYRNLILSLLRKSKKMHFAEFFEEHPSNVKKTWDGIRELINVSKKSFTNLNKIIHNKKVITDGKGIADHEQFLRKYWLFS